MWKALSTLSKALIKAAKSKILWTLHTPTSPPNFWTGRLRGGLARLRARLSNWPCESLAQPNAMAASSSVFASPNATPAPPVLSNNRVVRTDVTITLHPEAPDIVRDFLNWRFSPSDREEAGSTTHQEVQADRAEEPSLEPALYRFFLESFQEQENEEEWLALDRERRIGQACEHELRRRHTCSHGRIIPAIVTTVVSAAGFFAILFGTNGSPFAWAIQNACMTLCPKQGSPPSSLVCEA